MVRAFEITNGEARETDPAGDLAQASARLPHGAYTTLRTYGPERVVRLGQHVRRLEESAALQGQPAPIDQAGLRSGLAAALRVAGHAESRIRVTYAPPRLFAAVEPFEPLAPAVYEVGVVCVTLSLRRENPQAKDTRFLATAREAYGTLPAGRHEGLLIGEDGAVLEGLSSNFFAVREGILHTEEERALFGVTRSLVLEVARSVLPLATTAVRVEQLGELSESFLTSTSRGILPVVRIDEVRIGTGRPGPLTRELCRRFEELVGREAEPLV